VAQGSLGTGTAVDDDTKEYEVAAISWRPSGPANIRTSGVKNMHDTPSPAPVAPAATAAVGPAATAAAAPPPAPEPEAAIAPEPLAAPMASRQHAEPRRDPFRPVGIALAALFVALAGIAVLSNAGDPSADAVAPPVASATPGLAPDGNDDADDGGDGDGDQSGGGNESGDGNNGRGNGNGHGRGNDGNNGRGND
jgi:hypothetical protein